MKNLLILLTISILYSCSSDEYKELISDEEQFVIDHYEEDEESLVSELSVRIYSGDKAFGRAIPNLSRTQNFSFGVGNSMFDQSWVSSPASTTTRDGLGPLFNAHACANCHQKDGRGKPILNDNGNSRGFLIRLSTGNSFNDGPTPIPNYGNQLQDRANNTFDPEGDIAVNFTIINGKYPDGTSYELRKPTYTINNANYGTLANVKTSPRIGQQVMGLGFVDALSAASILANADEQDLDGDGISGKANYVWNVKKGELTIGKFGWKANQPSLEQQVAAAFNGDMGLTTNLFPEENCPHGIDCSEKPNGVNLGDISEVPPVQFNRILIYQTALTVPIRRNFKDIEVLKGKKLFNELSCVKCHVNNFTTSEYRFMPQLENIKIKPYSDFLLHDMGDELADHREDFLANGKEWRTQPLWGLGLIETVNNHTFLLHDGRARNIEEAILWHGGEAEKSKNQFMHLDKSQRAQLLAFLNSL
ncbi:di-heme oxidoreductase family protein [Wenyingzhuangia sp. IMCC45533]